MKKDKAYKEYSANLFLDGEVIAIVTQRVSTDYLRLFRLSKQGKNERIRKKNKARLNREIKKQIREAFKEWGKNEKKRVSEKMPPM